MLSNLLQFTFTGSSLSAGGLLGKFFIGDELNNNGTSPNGTVGPWRVAARTGDIGTLPLTITNESAPRDTGLYTFGTNNYDGVRMSTGMPSAAHMYGRNVWPYINYGGDSSDLVGNNFGFIAIGYFTPPVTGDYIFYTRSDDNSGVWLGAVAAAYSGRTIANATVNNTLESDSGHASADAVSSSVPLTAGVPVAIRIVHEDWYGGELMTFSWSGPGYPKTTDLSTYFSFVVDQNGVPTGNYLGV